MAQKLQTSFDSFVKEQPWPDCAHLTPFQAAKLPNAFFFGFRPTFRSIAYFQRASSVTDGMPGQFRRGPEQARHKGGPKRNSGTLNPKP